ncbi:helicase [Pseudomonas sp. ABC1]|uniref:SCP2 sterol-binding domain-containing protein n=1 Tax=Pseudomonas sp. ABC1 TaxID=2748080 RepID=UPI0015C36BEE|nr:helicase [Pseudomonas sp. ABC1]QLF93162.1 helicase [Pseudomonas sp. ABC1]
MKFRFLLWALGLLLARASRNNPEMQQELAGKDLSFDLYTLDGKVARHFTVKAQRISSRSGRGDDPAFSLGFRDASYGFATLQAKNKQLAFMQGIQDQHIKVNGNPALVLWFQGLTRYLKKR